MSSVDQKTKQKSSHSNKVTNLPINKSSKNINQSLKQQRSSKTHLNQYSKLLLLQKTDQVKSSIFLKKQSISTTNLPKNSKGQNKLLQNKSQNQQKLNKILENLKKKKLNTFTPQTGSNTPADLKQDIKASRIIKTSQGGSRNSLFTKRSSMGKLVLGKNFFPQKVPTKQERLDPFYQEPRIISQDIINKKGVYNLIHTGIIPSQFDFLELLNNKYELIPQATKEEQKKPEVIISIQDETQTFMTNPALLNQYEAHRKMSEAQLNIQQFQKKKNQEAQRKRNHKIRKTKIKKTKIPVNDPLQKISEILTVEVPFLSITNESIEKDQNFKKFLKQSLKQGNDEDLFQLIKKMEEFSKKYQIKKFKFKPNLSFGQRITQQNLISMIQNFKILGYDKTVNKKKNILESVIKRAFEMRHMKKIKVQLNKIQNFKKYFRMRKFYYEYVERRYNFYKYRFESFAEEQRKFIKDFVDRKMYIADYNPKVEIHILTKNTTFHEEKSYYKLRERLRAQLMRIINSQPADIIFLVDPVIIGDVKEEMKIFIKMAMKLGEKLSKITQKLLRIHIFQTGLRSGDISITGRIYYGITSEITKLVKDICNGQKPVIIPYESSTLLPFICELFNANLFGGTLTQESMQIINSDNQNTQRQIVEQDFNGKFKKIKRMPTFQQKISKLKNLQISNQVYEDKSNFYQLVSVKLKKPMPFRISTKNKTQLQFYQQVVTKISSHKQSTKWVFKLSKGKFSRGIALLETNDLKIFQQIRKKSQLTQKQITEISQLMSIILKDKIVLSQPYLMQKQKFSNDFFTNQNSYIEEYVQSSQKICIFGKILPNGTFIFMGTYKNHYTNGVGFGASYPAEQVDQSILEELKQISEQLGKQNVFGYVTFEFLYQQKSKRFLYLDFTPNLDEYSSFYFLYDTLFKSSQLYEQDCQFNVLPRKLFYCPFLDNNGNKFNEIQEFMDECRQKKVWYDSTNYQGQMFLFLKNDPSMLGLISISTSEIQSIKLCIDAISLLVEMGGKFNQFDKKYMGAQDSKTDGLYVMDILWKLRQIRKKLQNNMQAQTSKNVGQQQQIDLYTTKK